jgi:Cu-Zn family superoxide dismutase
MTKSVQCFLVAGTAVLIAFGCGSKVKTAVANIQSKSQSTLTGTGTFTAPNDGETKLHLVLQNMPSGSLASHIHAVGDCSAADATSAGGHWNPTEEAHGQMHANPDVPHHSGDIGNVDADTEVTSNEWTIGDGATTDVVGKALVVHAGLDDFATQPTGDAGVRIGCGVIELQE